MAQPISFRPTDEDQAALAVLTERTGRNRSEAIRFALRMAAEQIARSGNRPPA